MVYPRLMKSLGAKVQELRKKSGLTQVEFAKRVGVGLRLVRDFEQDRRGIRLDKLNQILKFLGHHLEIVSNQESRTEKSTG